MRALLVLVCPAFIAACDGPESPLAATDDPTLDLQLRSALQQRFVIRIGPVAPRSPALVDLGRALFFDRILSGNRDVSCATCHDLSSATTDGLSLAVGTGGFGLGAQRTPGIGRGFVPRNAPTLFNQGLGFLYLLWDGRVNGFAPGRFNAPAGIVLPPGLTDLLAAQAMLPVLNRVEMLGNAGDLDAHGNPNELASAGDSVAGVWQGIMNRLLAIPAYVAKLAAAYPGVPPATLGFQHAANAIAAYEVATLTRLNTPFDRYLNLNDGALTDEEKRGGILFFGKGRCASCHAGPLLGGDRFANIGVPQLGPGVGREAPRDVGRFEQFEFNEYRFAFRVPALRNVGLTAPYMHNGAYPTLEVVLRHYTNPDSALRNYDPTQVAPALRSSIRNDEQTHSAVASTLDFRVRDGIPLTEVERRQIIAFLKSLTDPSARNLSHLIPPSVPSGLPVR